MVRPHRSRVLIDISSNAQILSISSNASPASLEMKLHRMVQRSSCVSTRFAQIDEESLSSASSETTWTLVRSIVLIISASPTLATSSTAEACMEWGPR